MIAGVVLIVLAVVMYVVGTYVVSRLVMPTMMTVTLSPGGNVTVGTASPGEVLTVVYTDSINQPPLETFTSMPGVLKTMYTSGHYVVAYTVLSGTGTLYLVNNYSIPVTVKYSIVGVSITSSLLIGGMLILFALVIGIIGVVLAILGAVLKPRK